MDQMTSSTTQVNREEETKDKTIADLVSHWVSDLRRARDRAIDDIRALQALCKREISNSPEIGGGPLALGKLDELIDAVDRPTHLVMCAAMSDSLKSAAINPNVAGYIGQRTDLRGMRLTTYAGLGIIVADPPAGPEPMPLSFNETATAGGEPRSTSIYAVALKADHVHYGAEPPEWYDITARLVDGANSVARLRDIAEAKPGI